ASKPWAPVSSRTTPRRSPAIHATCSSFCPELLASERCSDACDDGDGAVGGRLFAHETKLALMRRAVFHELCVADRRIALGVDVAVAHRARIGIDVVLAALTRIALGLQDLAHAKGVTGRSARTAAMTAERELLGDWLADLRDGIAPLPGRVATA